jgi:hypothetical protein
LFQTYGCTSQALHAVRWKNWLLALQRINKKLVHMWNCEAVGRMRRTAAGEVKAALAAVLAERARYDLGLRRRTKRVYRRVPETNDGWLKHAPYPKVAAATTAAAAAPAAAAPAAAAPAAAAAAAAAAGAAGGTIGITDGLGHHF